MADDIYIIIIVATFVFFVLTFSIVYLGVVHNRRNAFFRQELLKAQIEIKEQTLQGIARELHDNLGQVASLIKINLHTMKLGDTQQAEAQLENTRDLVRQLLTDIKSLSISLSHDHIARLGLVRGLEHEVSRLNKTNLFEAQLTVEGDIPTLDNNTTTILYRMSQEVLNNFMKHSEARQIRISAQATGNLFRLAFRDNGVGFDKNERVKGEGSGLNNLHNRARMINARLVLESEPGAGTLVAIELPL